MATVASSVSWAIRAASSADIFVVASATGCYALQLSITLHNLHSQVSAWISFVKLPWTGMSPFLGRVGFGWHQISWRISTNLFASPKPA